MASKPKQNMIPHLIRCGFVSEDVRREAKQWQDDEKARSDSATASSSRSLVHARSLPLLTTTAPSRNAAPYDRDAESPYSGTGTPSPAPSPHLSASFLPPFPKRKRTSSTYDDSPIYGYQPWTPEMQADFGSDLCRMMIAIRASWNSASNPELRMFFEKWVPGAKVPDRRTLSGPILDREAAKVDEKMKQKLHGELATLTTDGWKNKAKQSIVATMVTAGSEVIFAAIHYMHLT